VTFISDYEGRSELSLLDASVGQLTPSSSWGSLSNVCEQTVCELWASDSPTGIPINHCVYTNEHAVRLIDEFQPDVDFDHAPDFVRIRCMLDCKCDECLVLHVACHDDSDLHQINFIVYGVVMLCYWHIMWSIGYVCMLLCCRHNHRANQYVIYVAVFAYAVAWVVFDTCFPRTVCLAFCSMVVLSSDGPTFVRASAYAAKCCASRRWKISFRPHLRKLLPSEYVKRIRIRHTLLIPGVHYSSLVQLRYTALVHSFVFVPSCWCMSDQFST
jgi:hypothetical protein